MSQHQITRLQCKDIPTLPVLRFLAGPYAGWPVAGFGTWYCGDYQPPNSVAHAMPAGIAEKLVLAKMRKLIRSGLVDGCPCGCRGDFHLTAKGLEVANAR